MTRFTILFAAVLMMCVDAFSQNKMQLYGKVVDEYDNPVEFASIIIEKQGEFTVSGSEGKYRLTCSRADSIFVTCMKIGYRTRKFKIYAPSADSMRFDMKISTKSIMLGEAGITAMRKQTDLVQRIKTKYTKQMPSTTGNGVEEIIATQMGVSTHNELSSQYNVRGGSFDENCVYLNGVEVFRPMLVRSGQQEGLSIINSNMVADIDFSAGGFPARYGDKMSSVLDITYKKPEHFEASLAGSLMGADTYVGFGNKNFSMMNGLRYKTTKYLMGTTDTDGEYNPRFLDFQNYTSWSPTKHWTFDFIGNISDNKYNFEPSDRETSFGTMDSPMSFKVYFDGQEKDLFRTYFSSLGITYKFNSSTALQWLSSAYSTKEQEAYDIRGEYWLNSAVGQEQLGVGTYLEHARNYLTARVMSTALNLRTAIKRHTIRAGISLKSEKIKEHSTEWEMRDSSGYSVPHSRDELLLVYNFHAKTEVTSTRFESYLQDNYRFNNKSGVYNLNFGVRLTHNSWNKETLVSPRASLGFIPAKNDNFTFRFATGYYYQSPFYKELRDTTKVGANTIVKLNHDIKSQRSIHFLLGMDYQFKAVDRPFRFSTEIYYKVLDNIIPYNVNNLRVVYYGENLAKGHVAGIDFKLFGEFVPGADSWITLSLMSTKQKYNGLSLPLPTDQRYNLSLFFTDFFPGSTRWKMTLKAALADGLPFGAPHSGIEGNNFRAPAYRRIDIGLSYRLLNNEDKHKRNNPMRNIWLGVDMLNLMDIKNVNSYYWITDITNRQYAVPNYLTGRCFNFRFLVEM
jgi:hypothetical protein